MNRRSHERGVAMVIVMMWGFAMVVLALIVSRAAINYIRPSDEAERSFEAWAAAEAGVDDLRARLIASNGDIKPVLSASTNPALAGWVPMPGGPSDVEFTYDVVSVKAEASGRIVVTSTGRAGDQVRTVEAQIQKRQMFDYAYASMYETIAPDYPDGWSGSGGYASHADAQAYCANRYWYVYGLAGPGLYGPRDSGLCVGQVSNEAKNWPIGAFYKFLGGPVHTNDVFMLDAAGPGFLPSFDPKTVFTDKVSSSCPDLTIAGQTVACPTNHRWLASGKLKVYDDQTGGPADPRWTIDYESPLEIRVEGRAAMKTAALRAGCVYTGPTRIVFNADGSFTVTSPDTKDADPPSANGITRDDSVNCGHDTLKGDGSTIASATTPKSATVTQAMLGSNFNGVVYVQSLQSLTASDPNAWGATTPPSCANKSAAGAFPFVVVGKTDPAFSSAVTTPGFPEIGTSTLTQSSKWERFSTDWPDDKASPTYASTCKLGTAYVEGTYAGKWTLVTEWDTALTSDILDASLAANLRPVRTATGDPTGVPTTLPDTWGVPPASSTNVMGLVPDRMLYVFGCSSEKGCGGDFKRIARTKSLVLNLSTVVVNGCLTVQDITSTGGTYGVLTYVGSLGQRYRCPIQKPSGNGGFDGLRVVYDARFKYMEPPPYISEMSNEPWKIMKIEEINAHITR